ncbi:unnamed protein product [Caenorhabditis angaria]|uniref:Major facilitator superfamily (MFS) profile domain-containing protein n=1 Tax=Caenorhabditis angaria TaxID=860376 RepID=A0A9P1IWM3_9PELO|nr:unnamed protein product [Caenorhabditis angaria]
MPKQIEVELKSIKPDEKTTAEIEAELENVAITTPPDGGYGWAIVLASFCINVIVDGVVSTIGKPIQPIWVQSLNVTNTSASLAVSILTACYYFTGPLASVLCDIYSCRRVAAIGAITAATGYALSAIAPNIEVLYITFGFIVGIGYGLLSFATGIAVCGSGIGCTVFALLNEVVLKVVNNNWQLFMMFLSAVSLTGIFFASLYKAVKPSAEQIENVTNIIKNWEVSKTITEETNELDAPLLSRLEQHEEVQNLQLGNDADITEIVEHDIEEINHSIQHRDELCPKDPALLENNDKSQKIVISLQKDKKTFRQACSSLFDASLLKSPSFIILAVSGLLTMIAFYVPFIYLQNHLEKIDDLTTVQMAFPVSLIGIVNVAGRIICGRLSDHPKLSALIVSAYTIIFAGLATCAVPLFNAYWQFLLYTVPFSFGVAALGALRSIIAVELVGVTNSTLPSES